MADELAALRQLIMVPALNTSTDWHCTIGVPVFQLHRRRAIENSVRTAHFFVSGRSRHTRSFGDWSSDVCSSDLVGAGFALGQAQPEHATIHAALAVAFGLWARRLRPRPGEKELPGGSELQDRFDAVEGEMRSEERRVGKGCR